MVRMSGFRILRKALVLAGIALGGFHGWLFAAQVAAGDLGDPWVIFRWIAAAGLVAALITVRRNGDSVFGRKGIAIWVLAALLHGPAVSGSTDLSSIALPEKAAAAVFQLVSSAALGIGLWMLAGLLSIRRAQPVRLRSFVPAYSAAGFLAAGVMQQFSPRPPPLRS
jgi:hypothetical protein